MSGSHTVVRRFQCGAVPGNGTGPGGGGGMRGSSSFSEDVDSPHCQRLSRLWECRFTHTCMHI